MEAKHSALEFDVEEKPLSSFVLVWTCKSVDES